MGEHGTRVQPFRDVIAADVIQKIRQEQQNDILKFFEVLYFRYLFQRIRIAKHKITETKIIGYRLPQVHIHLLEFLSIKLAPYLDAYAALSASDDWIISGIKGSSLRISSHSLIPANASFSLVGKTHIRNHSQYIILISVIYFVASS